MLGQLPQLDVTHFPSPVHDVSLCFCLKQAPSGTGEGPTEPPEKSTYIVTSHRKTLTVDFIFTCLICAYTNLNYMHATYYWGAA